MELLASVHFVVDRQQVGSNDAHAITKKLQAFGKGFSKSEVSAARAAFRNRALLKS